MNVRHPMGVLHLFFFYDKVGLQALLFSCNEVVIMSFLVSSSRAELNGYQSFHSSCVVSNRDEVCWSYIQNWHLILKKYYGGVGLYKLKSCLVVWAKDIFCVNKKKKLLQLLEKQCALQLSLFSYSFFLNHCFPGVLASTFLGYVP